MDKRIFIIGDVHGCSATLQELLINITNINSNDELIFLGDLIDKGTDSKSVIDFILSLIEMNYDVKTIRGNHEQMLLDSLNSPKSMREWFRNGGKETLDSFEVYHPGFIEEKYINFFNKTIPYILMEKYIITHAGLNFAIVNPLIDTKKMLTTRNEYNDKTKIGGRRLIVGHTPIPTAKIRYSLNSDIIMLDGGCVYYKKVQGLGYLAALELNSMELFYSQNIE